MRILFYKALLPRHCDVKLVEQALDLLQIYPDERELLNNIGNYIKNDLFEYIGYWGVLIGTIGSCCSAGITCVVIIVYPLVFRSYLGVFSICIIATATTFFVLDAFYGCALGLKFVRWIGDRVEGTQQKPTHLKEFAEKLKARIHGDGDEIEEAVEETTHEETLMPLDENSCVESQKYRLARQCLDHFWSTGSIMPNAQLNILRESQRTTYQYSGPCSLDSRP